jgi:two-component system chemotaxis response regulator CheY
MPNSAYKIALVDDDPHIRLLFKRVVLQAGFVLAGEADNGESAIALHTQTTPDLTLLDVSMPKMDGIEALKRILEKSPAAKVAMLTATSDETLIQNALSAGAKHCIRKDLPLAEIRATLERILKSP